MPGNLPAIPVELWNAYDAARTARRASASIPATVDPNAIEPAVGWAFPVSGYSGKVDPHWGSHRGAADIFAPRGTPVVAAMAGKVADAGWDETGGFNVLIDGADGHKYYYAHLEGSPAVRSGQQVQTGAYLGGVGNTGNAAHTEPHLHFGAGRRILLGTGPAGGAGEGLDVTALLSAALTSRTQQRAAGAFDPMSEMPRDWDAAAAYVATQAMAQGLGEDGARAAIAVMRTEGGWQGKPNLGDIGRTGGPGVGGSSEGGWQLNFAPGNPGHRFAARMGISPVEAQQLLRRAPLAGTDWWLSPDGDLGRAIREGQANGLSGAQLATYAQARGQRSIRPETAGANWGTMFGAGQPLPASDATGPTGVTVRPDPRRGMLSRIDQYEAKYSARLAEMGAPPDIFNRIRGRVSSVGQVSPATTQPPPGGAGFGPQTEPMVSGAEAGFGPSIQVTDDPELARSAAIAESGAYQPVIDPYAEARNPAPVTFEEPPAQPPRYPYNQPSLAEPPPAQQPGGPISAIGGALGAAGRGIGHVASGAGQAVGGAVAGLRERVQGQQYSPEVEALISETEGQRRDYEEANRARAAVATERAVDALRAGGVEPTPSDRDRLERTIGTMIDPENVAVGAALVAATPLTVTGALALAGLQATGMFTGGKMAEALGGDETAQLAGEIIGGVALPVGTVAGINVGAARAAGARRTAQASRQGAFDEAVARADVTHPFQPEAPIPGPRALPAAPRAEPPRALPSAEGGRLPPPVSRPYGAQEPVFAPEGRQAAPVPEGTVVEQPTPRRPGIPERGTPMRPAEFTATMEREPGQTTALRRAAQHARAAGDDAAELAVRRAVDDTPEPGLFGPQRQPARPGAAQEPTEELSEAERMRQRGEAGLFEPAPAPSQPRPAPTAPARAGAAPPVGAPSDVVLVPVRQIKVAPDRFQFKQLVDRETGAGAKLKDARYNERLAGTVYGWQDASGDIYVVNGHHRVDLAKRTGHPAVRMMIDREADGVTEQQARAIGAMQNIAEDMGTEIDVAKFLRDSNANVNLLRSHGISPSGRLASRGAALSELDEPLFREVIQGTLPADQAVVIGHGLPGNFPAQRDAAAMVKAERLSERETRALVGHATGENIQLRQEGLFGETISERSTLAFRARLQSYIGDQLAKDRRLFGFVAQEQRAQELARGRNIIDVGESGRIASESAQASAIFDALANRAGPIADAISEGARRLARGDHVQTVRADTLRAVRDAVVRERPGVAPGPQAHPVGETGGAGRPATGGLAAERRPAGEPPSTGERGGFGAALAPDLGSGAAGSALSQADTDEDTPTEERVARALLGFGALGFARKIQRTRDPSLRKIRQMDAPSKSKPAIGELWQGFLTRADPRDAFPRFRQIEKAALATDPTAPRAHNLAVRMAGSSGEADAILETELRPILRSVVKADVDLDDLNAYLRSAQTVELVDRGISVPGGVTRQQALDALDALYVEIGPAKFDAIERAERALQDFQTRNFLERARGTFLTDQQVTAFQQANSHYFPHEVLDYISEHADAIPVGRPPISVATQAFKARKGSERDVATPLDAIVRKTYRIENAMVRNEAAKALVDDLLTIDPAGAPSYNPTTGRPLTKDEGTISYFWEGEKHTHLVDASVAGEARQMDAQQVNTLTRIARAINAVPRVAFTSLSPDFITRNPVRDALEAFYREGLTPLGWHHARGILSALSKDADWEAYLRSRAGIGGLFETTRKETPTTVRELARSTPERIVRTAPNPLALITRVNEILEQGTRIGVFTAQSGLRRGPSLPRPFKGWIGEPPTDVPTAAAHSREASVDFGNAHHLIRTLNPAVLFLNAQVKGLFNVGSPLLTDKPGRRLRAVLRGSLLVTAAAAAYAHNRSGEFADLYEDIPQFERDNSVILLYGSGTNERGKQVPAYIAFAKPNALKVGWNLVEDLMRYVEGNHPRDWNEIAGSLIAGLTPLSSTDLSGLAPPAFSLPGDLAADWDPFRGVAIEGRLRELPRTERVRPGTSEVAKSAARSPVAEAFGWSPVQIDYIVQGFTGGAGRAATFAAEWGGELAGVFPPETGPAPSTEVRLSRTPAVRGILRAYGGASEQRKYEELDRRMREAEPRIMESLEGFGQLQGASLERRQNVLRSVTSWVRAQLADQLDIERRRDTGLPERYYGVPAGSRLESEITTALNTPRERRTPEQEDLALEFRSERNPEFRPEQREQREELQIEKERALSAVRRGGR